MASRIGRFGVAAVGVGVAVASLGLGPAASAHAASPVARGTTAKKAANVDILGMWVAAPGDTNGGVYTSESKSGVCKGTTPYGPGYSLRRCRVVGDKLTFVIAYGSSYKSYNTDIVTGNHLTGEFHDTNGTQESYTSVRETDIPTKTTLSCKKAGTKARCTTLVTYNDKGDVEGVPTGTVTFAGKVHAASCTLKAGKKADTASCSAKLLPAHAGHRTLAVTATYGGSSAHFRKSVSKKSTVKVA